MIDTKNKDGNAFKINCLHLHLECITFIYLCSLFSLVFLTIQRFKISVSVVKYIASIINLVHAHCFLSCYTRTKILH